MTRQDIILKLKEDLNKINFYERISEWKDYEFSEQLTNRFMFVEGFRSFNHKENFKLTFEIVDRYEEVFQLIAKAIDAGIYIVTDQEFCNILKDILEPCSNYLSEDIIIKALDYRDKLLNRPPKSEIEYKEFHALYFGDGNNNEKYVKNIPSTREIILKLKEDLNKINFIERMSEWENEMSIKQKWEKKYANTNEDYYKPNQDILDRYEEGFQLIKSAIDSHLYMLNDQEFFALLIQIQATDLLANFYEGNSTIRNILDYRDKLLYRAQKDKSEYYDYFNYLIDCFY